MATPKCMVCELELTALLESRLTDSRARQLREHTDGCAYCAVRMRALDSLAARLRSSSPLMTSTNHVLVSRPPSAAATAQLETWLPRRRRLSWSSLGLALVAAFTLLELWGGAVAGPAVSGAATRRAPVASAVRLGDPSSASLPAAGQPLRR